MSTDAALGKAFDLLFNLTKNAVVKVVKFKPILNEIKSFLESIEPKIRDITNSKMALGQTGGTTENLESLMKEGRELIEKCLKVKRWMICEKGRYCGKLRAFNEKLQKEINTLPVETTRDGKQTLLHLLEIKRNGKESLEIERENSIVIQEMSSTLKQVLGSREGGSSVLMVTAPGVWEKTTLAIRFCHDRVKECRQKDASMYLADIFVEPGALVELTSILKTTT